VKSRIRKREGYVERKEITLLRFLICKKGCANEGRQINGIRKEYEKNAERCRGKEKGSRTIVPFGRFEGGPKVARFPAKTSRLNQEKNCKDYEQGGEKETHLEQTNLMAATKHAIRCDGEDR